MKIIELKTRGFVDLSYPPELRRAVEKAEESWRKFCELPQEKKALFGYSNNSAGVGYEKKDGSGPMGDIKENFDIALSGFGFLEGVLQEHFDPEVVARNFINDALALVEVMTPFVVSFALEAEQAFGLVGFCEEIRSGRESFFVRFIHYPPQKTDGESTAQAHLDQSGFTLHLFESDPGLECLTFEGEWIPMPVSKSRTVIISDMQLQFRSKGEILALWHRVTANKKTSSRGRYSAVSFIQFKDTPKYNKDENGRLQEKPEGFNYKMPIEQFRRLFKE